MIWKVIERAPIILHCRRIASEAATIRSGHRPPCCQETKPFCRGSARSVEQRDPRRSSVVQVFREPHGNPRQFLGKVALAQIFDFVGAPGRIRTSDPQIRSLVLYPAELRAHMCRTMQKRPERISLRCPATSHYRRWIVKARLIEPPVRAILAHDGVARQCSCEL
jgi:hypothetical protein